MRRWIGMVVVAAATAAGGPPVAAGEISQPIEFEKGVTELSLWGALDVDEGDEAWLWFGGDVGFLVSPRHEVGATVYLQFRAEDWVTALGSACGGFYRYNIPIGSRRVVPFVGFRAVGYLGEYEQWDAEVRAEGGIWHFVSEGMAINLTGYYGRRFGHDCEGGYCPEDRDRWGMSVGLSVFF